MITKLRPAQVKLLAKYYIPMEPSEEKLKVTNPFNGITREVNITEKSIIDRILDAVKRGIVGIPFKNGGMPVQDFDNLRYALLAINPDVYYDIID